MLIKKLKEHVESNPSSIAVIYKNKKITYLELWNNILNYYYQINNKYKEDDIVIVENTNDDNYIYMILALNLKGVISLPIDKGEKENKKRLLKKKIGAVDIVSSLEKKNVNNNTSLNLNNVYSKNKIINILLSSGSTGEEKLITYTNDNIYNSITNFHDAYKLGNKINVIVTGPISHAYSLIKVYMAVYYGYTITIHNGANFVEFINYIVEDDMNNIMLCTNPTFLHYTASIFRKELEENISKIKLIEIATAPLSINDAELLVSICNGRTKLINHYGSTEYVPICYKEVDKNYEFGCVGAPYKNTKIEIIDNNLSKCGSIRISGNSLANYYGKEKSFYFYTGDVGYFKGDDLYIIDREKNFFNVNGYKISPVEIENAALKYDGILECICCYQNVLTLYVVKKKEYQIEKLKEKLQSELIDYKIPKKIIETNSIIKLSNGKIDRSKY